MANKKRGKKSTAANDDRDNTKRHATATAPVDDNTTLVPAAVLSRILDYSSQATVLNVAAVCKSWRGVAQAHELYYAHVSLDGDGCGSVAEHSEKSKKFFVSIFDAVHDAHFKRLHVFLSSPTPDEVDDFEDGDDEVDEIMINNLTAVKMIEIQMRYIVHLDMSLPYTYKALLEMFLRTKPAPVLEELYFCFDGEPEAGPGPFASLPPDLFHDSAPALKSVTLTGVELTAKPVRAFANVRRVSLQQYSSEALLFVPHNFPGTTHLTLDFLDADFDNRYIGLDEPVPPQAVKSLGARLQHLELNLYASEMGLPTQLRTILEKQAIPSIAVSLCADEEEDDSEIAGAYDFAPFLAHVGKPYRVVLRRERQYSGPTAEDWERRPHDAEASLVMEVFSLGSHFKRKFTALEPLPASETALLRRLPELAPHIRELEVADVLLRELFRELDSGSLPRLKRLTIDFDSPQRDEANAWEDFARRGSGKIECSNLESVTLRCVMAYRPSVNDQDVANVLARFKPGSKLPELCCTGVTLSAGDDGSLLSSMVEMRIA
ncbi:hypothetical protein EXIGLDRAFT_753657 [Exidia glandulosa HHB12029]|uniref:F-box domain-containing protein n=1 Tax=Exidia glandulosa HHB12029 TaxID=1314781 RepID=A0A165ZPV5_EXIGL|nr:hypothetical protein EXIGLDRAFT_753657 [Exidia glandulosa HHB12029]